MTVFNLVFQMAPVSNFLQLEMFNWTFIVMVMMMMMIM